jgi:hypothetical protein
LNGFSEFLVLLVFLKIATMAVQLSEKTLVVKGHEESFARAKELIEKFNLPGASRLPTFDICLSCLSFALSENQSKSHTDFVAGRCNSNTTYLERL